MLIRKNISNNLIEQRFINEMVLTHDKDIKLFYKFFNELSKKVKNKIYFNGQNYVEYSIIGEVKYELIMQMHIHIK